MSVHPIRFTRPVPCSGLVATDEEIALRLDAGVYKKMTDDSRVQGKLIAVEKADTGSTPELCTMEYMGIIRFKIADTVTLANTDLDKGIKGAASGAIKLVAYSSTYDEDLVGRVVDWDNTTGAKWVDVLMPAQ